MKLKVLSTAFVTLFLISSDLFAVNIKSLDDLHPTRDQVITSMEIVNQLSRRHYRRAQLNDELSQSLFDRYLASMDSNKSVFLQSDIDEFSGYRNTLDDSLRRGDLTPGFRIYNRYRARLVSRLEEILENLPQRLATLDFTKNEDLLIDRENAPWPKDIEESRDIWRKTIKSAVLNLRLAGKEPDKIEDLIQKRFKNQLDRIKQLNSEDAFQLYMNALSQLYDPHTSYFSPRNSENFNIHMSLKLEGIGAVLQREDEYTKVVRLVHAGPADKQGELQAADRIVGVGQGREGEIIDVIGWRLDEVVQLIRGKRNTIVKLEVIPVDAKTVDETKIIEITRDEVRLEEQAAQKHILEITDKNNVTHKIGVIDIPAFYIDFEALRRRDPNYKSTTRDVSRLLAELQQERVSGIIVDLRNNGGGSLKEANELTGLFIDHGPTVQIRHASERVFREQKLSSTPYYDGPLVVLINRLSASASEIFAAAMQDYQRGIVIGGQSFGKGTVQSLTPLRQGQLKLTESKFYRISGDSTQHRGVVPDILLPSLFDKEKVGESALDGALSWDQIDAVRHKTYFEIPLILDTLKAKHEQRISTNPDFQFMKDQVAFNQRYRSYDRISLNEKHRKLEEEQEKAEQLAIENKRRKAKGIELLTKFDEEDDEHTRAELAKVVGEQDEEDKDTESADDAKDIFLVEAGHILVDAIGMFSGKVAAN